jgi:hypothetical protein
VEKLLYVFVKMFNINFDFLVYSFWSIPLLISGISLLSHSKELFQQDRKMIKLAFQNLIFSTVALGICFVVDLYLTPVLRDQLGLELSVVTFIRFLYVIAAFYLISWVFNVISSWL